MCAPISELPSNISTMDKAAFCVDDTLYSIGLLGGGERTLIPGYVREPGHHGGLQGVQSVLVRPVYDPLPSASPWATIFAGPVKGSSKGPIIILRTP